MKSFDYEMAEDTNKLIDKLNKYVDELGFIFEGKIHKISGKYLYHSSRREFLDEIKKKGLMPYKAGNLVDYLDENYERDNLKHYVKIKSLLSKLKLVYLASTTSCCIYNTVGYDAYDDDVSYNKTYTMFRFNKSLVSKYLYHDVESFDCEALVSIINIPPQYLEIGYPVKKLILKGEQSLDYVYKWKNLI